MYIKRLDLLGFKSFASKTSIAFKRGICAVVGPNGCGKSNVVDGIRWVLGESSARELRGHKMHDVIFAGAAERAPLNLAEVNILLDNEDNTAAAPYQHCPEIMVTRRLFRSGESEYLINKTPVRRLDIQLLFMDTGLGQSRYAIIEQGKISQVVEARPEELHELLEEAAGIMRFKTRKKVALKKMELTQQNLERIDDLCNEIGRQVKRLAAEARRAREHRALRDEVRRLELHLAIQELEGLVNRQDRLRAGIDAVVAELANGHLAWQDWQQQWRDFEDAQQNVNDALQTERELYRNAENQLELTRKDQNHQETQRRQAEERLQQAEQQLAVLARRQLQGEAERAVLETRLQALAPSIAQQQRDLAALETGLETARAERHHLGAWLDERKTEIVEVLSRKTQAGNELIMARRQLQELNRRSAQRRQEFAALQPSLATSRAGIEELEERIADLQDALAELTAREKQAQLEIQQAEQDLQTLHQELRHQEAALQKNQSRLQALQELETRYEWYDQDVRKLLLDQSSRGSARPAVEVLARYLEVSPATIQAVEAVLGELLQGLVADSLEDVPSLIQALKQQKGGKVSFFPLPFWRHDHAAAPLPAPPCNGHRPLLQEVRVPARVQPLLRTLLDRVFLVEDLGHAIDSWLETPFLYSFVTSEGDCLFADGRILARSLAAGQSVLHKRHEIAELEQLCARQQNLCEAHQTQVDAAQDRVHALSQRLTELRQDLTMQSEVLRQAESSCIRLHSDRQKWLDKMELLSAESQRDEEEIRFHQETVEKNELLGQQHSQAEATLRAELVEMELKQRQLHEQVQTSEKAFVQGQIVFNQDRQSLAQGETDHQRLAKLLSETVQRLAACRQDQVTSQQRVAQCGQQQALLLDQERALEEALQNSRERAAEREEEQRVVKRQQVELESRRDQLRRLYRARQETQQELEREGTELALQLEFLRRRILENYRVELDQITRDQELEVLERELIVQRLDEGKRRLEKLGEVNYAAITDYDEQKERHDFLQSQRQDLEKTIQDLQQALQQIQRTSRKRFMETFTAVDSKLREIFPVLLGGGSARLQLLDDEHPLESGVELLVKLPGKRTSSMMLLSGGEKALTALALLFALSMIKPSPFLLLDEVDAPLDEVNVGRFCELIEKLQEKSQVILISHNKRTMEMAQQLVGVTMDEPGVSRVISLQLC
jgi:chromosome segregation protein